jgi:hypothetical protein
MDGLKMPDITPAQIVAIVTAVLGTAVAAGLDISDDLQNSIIQLVTVLGAVLFGADALIRHGRSRALGVAPRPALEEEVDVVEGDAGRNRPAGI